MKKSSKPAFRDLPASGRVLTDEGLRLVAGGMPKLTHPSSYSEPPKPDTATDD